MIYLRFITERWSLESGLIRFGTRWWPSHVEFVRVENGVAVDTLGSRLSDGVRIRPYGYCHPTREEWWTAPYIEQAYENVKSIIGAPYDWIDILGFAFARDWHRAGHYICSAVIDKGFKMTPGPLTNEWMPIHRVSPRDLLIPPQVEFVWRVK